MWAPAACGNLNTLNLWIHKKKTKENFECVDLAQRPEPEFYYWFAVENLSHWSDFWCVCYFSNKINIFIHSYPIFTGALFNTSGKCLQILLMNIFVGCKMSHFVFIILPDTAGWPLTIRSPPCPSVELLLDLDYPLRDSLSQTLSLMPPWLMEYVPPRLR